MTVPINIQALRLIKWIDAQRWLIEKYFETSERVQNHRRTDEQYKPLSKDLFQLLPAGINRYLYDFFPQ